MSVNSDQLVFTTKIIKALGYNVNDLLNKPYLENTSKIIGNIIKNYSNIKKSRSLCSLLLIDGRRIPKVDGFVDMNMANQLGMELALAIKEHDFHKINSFFHNY